MFQYPKTYLTLGVLILGIMLLSVSTKTESHIYNKERGISKQVIKCMERGFDYSSCKQDPSQK
jgi:hypothetical protein